MNKGLLLVCLIAVIGCQRKEDGSPSTGTLPATCNYGVATLYNGSITAGSSPTTITTAADPLGRHDKLSVYICRASTCDPVPPNPCLALTLAQQVSTPCYTTTPSVNIVWGVHYVKIVNAGIGTYSNLAQANLGIKDIPAYSTYMIAEQLCN